MAILQRLGTLTLVLVGTGLVLVAAGRAGGHLTGHASTELGWKQWAALWVGTCLMLCAAALAPLRQDDLFAHRKLPRLRAKRSRVFNLLAWATSSVAGESEVAYRLWSVLPAIAAGALMCWWGWTRLGQGVAVAVAVLTVTSPLIPTLARDARGYGLAFLAGALMLAFADRVAREQSRRNLFGFGSAGLIGAATLPVFALAFVAQALPLVVRRETRTRVVGTVAAVGLLLLLLYAPLIGDILDAAGQQFGRKLAWHGPLTTAATDLLGPNVQIVSAPDLPPELPNASVAGDNAIAGAIALIGAVLLWRTGERLVTALLVVPPLVTYSVLTFGDFFVEPRFAAFLLFHMIVLAACGIVGLIEVIPDERARWAATAVAAVAGSYAAVHALQAGDALHDLPRENFKEAAEVVRANGGSRVLTDSTRPQGLQYYLGTENVVQQPPPELELAFCSSNEPVVYVEHPFRGSPLEPPPPDLRCLRQRGAHMVRVHQRERGQRIDVWTLNP